MTDETTVTTTTTVTIRGGGRTDSVRANEPLTFERLALVILLCTPNQFHVHWRQNETTAMKSDLAQLGLSQDGAALLISMLNTIDQREEKETFITLGAAMKALMYDGGEPHPPFVEVIVKSVAALRGLD